MVSRIRVRNFKKIEDAEIPLSKINVLVGGNNSGKSCIIQGIHFGATLAQSRRIAGTDQFPPEQLRYCPTDDFLNLHRNSKLTESSSIVFTFTDEKDGSLQNADISLTRGRNGVVKAQTSGGSMLETVAHPSSHFSIYVPGLAGIIIREEFRGELVVNNGIARGDANLFLRNLLLRIARSEERQRKFDQYLDKVFAGFRVKTYFNEANDLWIRTEIIDSSAKVFPIDMVGTGLLQAIQLIAYVTMYEPKLLLLDEPDAHLHPSNQRLLARTLEVIVEEIDTKVLLATHSRHLIDAFSDTAEAKLFWVKNGTATPQPNWSDIAILMDLGALDNGERFLAGDYQYLIWTEDTDKRYLETFIQANGFDLKDVLLFSYQTSSKVDAAKLMSAFVERIRPGVRTIIHRDRDFMTDEEVLKLINKYDLGKNLSLRLFITRYSDIESYFASEGHVSASLQTSLDVARTAVEGAIQDNMNEFVAKFIHKRDEIKRDLYKNDPNDCPNAMDFLPGSGVPVEKALGKLLLKRCAPRIQLIGKNPGLLLNASSALVDADFQKCFQ